MNDWPLLLIGIILGIYSILFINKKVDEHLKESSLDEWEYGMCNGRKARRHRDNGNVQFILWNAGEYGHKEDFWHDLHTSWWPNFKPL